MGWMDLGSWFFAFWGFLKCGGDKNKSWLDYYLKGQGMKLGDWSLKYERKGCVFNGLL